jgi:hypothetical protein
MEGQLNDVKKELDHDLPIFFNAGPLRFWLSVCYIDTTVMRRDI